MDTLLVKIFATALTFSQVVSAPDALKTHFDPIQNRQQAIDLLRAGCEQVRKAFDVETVNLDDLITTAMEDPDAVAGEHAAAFRGIKIEDLHTAYRQFCKNETVQNSPVDLGEVIEFYNRTLADLPDYTHLPTPCCRVPASWSTSTIKATSWVKSSRKSGDASGYPWPRFPRTCRTLLCRPKTSDSINTTESMSIR